tara:strand:+ start:447 stop:641 length:195 start_codon:yes stop_codon:yes gene_type:complete
MDYDDWLNLGCENQYITKYLKIREEKLQLASSTLKKALSKKGESFLRKKYLRDDVDKVLKAIKD